MKKGTPVLRRINRWPSSAWLAVLFFAGSSQIAGAQARPLLVSHLYPLAQQDTAEGHFRQGSRLDVQGNLDQAIAEYRKAIRLNPKYAEAHFSLPLALRNKGNLDGAITKFGDAIAWS